MMMDIDEDSATLAESAHVFRSRRNRQVPISRLPDEILLMIFKHIEEETRLTAQDIDDGRTISNDTGDDVPACLAVTHVCSHWRKIALKCPSLWNLISTTSTFWLDIMLERSQKVPLVVKYSAFDISLDEFLGRVLLHLPRIKHLELYTVTREADRVMELLSSQPALMLETCKFLVSGLFPPGGSTTNTIFQGVAPLLRSLEVYHCGRGWTSCTFGGLRSLRVGKTELSDLLTALQCMPSLEQLTFTGGLLQSNQPLPINKVPLARLKNIALNEALSQDAVSLFQHLALPVDIKIAIRLLSIEGLQPIADLFSVMDKHPHESGPVFRSLRAIQSEQWRYCVQFSTSTTINVCDDIWNPQDDDIRLTVEYNYYENDAAVSRDLVFEICNIIAHRRRQTFFSGQFEFIHVEGCRGFIRGLTDALRIVEGSPGVPYPSLRALRLQDIQFEGDELQDFLDVLTMRVQQNAPIHELWLWLCHNLSADQVELCRKVVSAVYQHYN
ncbi:hypothetical protein P692DRAFT_20948367 [Suillus brevipes Sb2]|nr:hypothetical protein P692DRAFT_20948367 [Suillus brevipes Sb2]